jgi:D-alanyl-lipoteichoic acid acyltransferase DltB (MBOAT superfamily)
LPFAFGLFKKAVLADGIAPHATSIFTAAEHGESIGINGRLGALAYTLQIYFDFSGYSDMAIGLARMFGSACRQISHPPLKSRTSLTFSFGT